MVLRLIDEVNTSSAWAAVLNRIAIAFQPAAYSVHTTGKRGWWAPSLECTGSKAAVGKSAGMAIPIACATARIGWEAMGVLGSLLLRGTKTKTPTPTAKQISKT